MITPAGELLLLLTLYAGGFLAFIVAMTALMIGISAGIDYLFRKFGR